MNRDMTEAKLLASKRSNNKRMRRCKSLLEAAGKMNKQYCSFCIHGPEEGREPHLQMAKNYMSLENCEFHCRNVEHEKAFHELIPQEMIGWSCCEWKELFG